MVYELTEKREFEASVEQVWGIISEHERMPDWMTPGMKVYVKPEGAHERNGVGAVRNIRAGSYCTREEVVGFEPPHKLSYSIRSGLPVKEHLSEIVLEPVGERTQLVWKVRFKSKYLGLGWIVHLIVRRAVRQGLRRLGPLLN